MKYVILRNTDPIIFSEDIQHSTFKGLGPTSAGFCSIMDGHLVISGFSISLGMRPGPNDKEILKKHLFTD